MSGSRWSRRKQSRPHYEILVLLVIGGLDMTAEKHRRLLDYQIGNVTLQLQTNQNLL